VGMAFPYFRKPILLCRRSVLVADSFGANVCFPKNFLLKNPYFS
jgi:hypothetical protein